MDMPDLVGMRVTMVNGADVKKYPLEKAIWALKSAIELSHNRRLAGSYWTCFAERVAR